MRSSSKSRRMAARALANDDVSFATGDIYGAGGPGLRRLV
jgi:hypothetical protein